jgi:hypothetical protein
MRLSGDREMNLHFQTLSAFFLVPTNTQESPVRYLMLPEDTVVLLVHAHRILNCLHAPQKVGEVRVKVLDEAHAIAALLEAVRVLAQAVLSGIKGVLPVVGGLRKSRKSR